MCNWQKLLPETIYKIINVMTIRLNILQITQILNASNTYIILFLKANLPSDGVYF